jgi:hypothetical protein
MISSEIDLFIESIRKDKDGSTSPRPLTRIHTKR